MREAMNLARHIAATPGTATWSALHGLGLEGIGYDHAAQRLDDVVDISGVQIVATLAPWTKKKLETEPVSRPGSKPKSRRSVRARDVPGAVRAGDVPVS